MRSQITQKAKIAVSTSNRCIRSIQFFALFIASTFFATTTPAPALANCDTSTGGLDLANCYTVGIGKTTTVQSLFATPADLINLIIMNLVGLSGLFLLFLFIFAGFQYISDTSKGKDRAREILTNALYGAILIFCAYWIVQIALFVTGIDASLGIISP